MKDVYFSQVYEINKSFSIHDTIYAFIIWWNTYIFPAMKVTELSRSFHYPNTKTLLIDVDRNLLL